MTKHAPATPLDLAQFKVHTLPAFSLAPCSGAGDFTLIQWERDPGVPRSLRSLQVERPIAELWAMAPALLVECQRVKEMYEAADLVARNTQSLLEHSRNQFAALRDREQSIRAANVVLAAALELVMDHEGKLTGSDWTVIRGALERNIKVNAR